MLVLHSSSRCDVCLSDYSWESTGKRPHAIACGHIFCRDCLYANSPPLCPLCRKVYQPNKMKKLHVDRPENIDDHKEIDLLQRLAVSWEMAPEQLEEVTTEVDVWLRDRADDACIALRKARAALEKNQKLQVSEALLQDAIRQLHERTVLLDSTLVKERTLALAQSEGYKTMIQGLTKDIIALKMEIEGMQSLTYRYTHSRNPLPRPPEPIPTDQVPTFQQAVSESGAGMRFVELPSSPLRYPEGVSFPLRYSFNADNGSRSHRKGKSRPKDLKDDTKYRSSSSLTQQALLSPRHNPSPSHYVHPHVSQPAHYGDTPLSSTRASNLQTHLENTAQPLDEYELVHLYLREYSSGFVNGQQFAAGNKATEYPGRSHTALPAHVASTSTRYPVQPTTVYEQNQTYRQGTTNIYQNQAESSYQSSRHRPTRQETAPSIISSSASSAPHGRSPSPPRSRSRPQSRNGSLTSAPLPTQIAPPNIPLPASVYSTPPPDMPVRPSSHRDQQDSIGPTSPIILASPQQQPQQIQPLPRGPSSIASGRTHNTVLSSDTWGTAARSDLRSGSLISGLLAFGAGAEPVLVGGQEPLVFRELGSDGASVHTRASFSESVGDAPMQAPPQSLSPPRPIGTMVGVLPPEEDSVVSPYNRHADSTRSPREDRRLEASYRSPTAVDPRAQYGHGGRGQQGTVDRDGGLGRNGFASSGYQTESGERSHRHRSQQSQQYPQTATSQWHGSHQPSNRRDDRSNTYRSPTAADHHRTSYATRGEAGYSRDRSHTSSSSYSSRNHDDRRQSNSHSHSHSQSQSYYHNDDQRSIASSDRHSRSSHASRAPSLPTRGHHLSLPDEFPLTVEYTDDDDDDDDDDDEEGLDDHYHSRHHSRSRDSQRDAADRSRRGSRGGSGGGAPESAPVAGAESEAFGNALGLQLSTGPAPLSAPTPVASSHTFLRS